ncbi:MAG: class I SAM-dependent methyltransferase [Bacteroidaceae bacterium]|nr:class I SAM-dependent methyltransferase [Bacteroidaceae bacterium]
MSPIERHYLKHKEELRLQRRHGQVEFRVTMHYLQRYLTPGCRVLDIGAGTGHYTHALRRMGYDVDAVELVQRNIDVMLAHDPSVNVRRADARDLSFIPDDRYDVVLLFGPLYHLMGDAEKLKALCEARRVMKPTGTLLVAYLMNEYSIVEYCFAENRMDALLREGTVSPDFHVTPREGELYDYIRLVDADRLRRAARLERVTQFSPDGPTDYMRVRLNQMDDANFEHFVRYVTQTAERPDLLGAASHLVDVLRRSPETDNP